MIELIVKQLPEYRDRDRGERGRDDEMMMMG